MSDEEISDDRSPTFARLYDYFKHMTTISLVAIGGVLGLVQSGEPKVSAPSLLVIIFTLSAAGLVSLTSLSILAGADIGKPLTDKQLKRLQRFQPLANLLLMLGLGIFLGVFMRILK